MLKSAEKSDSFSTVALIGADGSGKTTIANAIMNSAGRPIKYLYMGVNAESSNVALPTTRLAHWIKVRAHKKKLKQEGRPVPKRVDMHGVEHRVDRRGKIGAFLRLLKRVTEESYRQGVSWCYQLRGNIVLYDRHFLFDACPAPDDREKHRLTDRIHNWFLRRLYPRPELVIFLDAPSTVLYERKQEVPVEYLDVYRNQLLRKRAYAKRFYVIQTDQPVADVIAEVTQLIARHCRRDGILKKTDTP